MSLTLLRSAREGLLGRGRSTGTVGRPGATCGHFIFLVSQALESTATQPDHSLLQSPPRGHKDPLDGHAVMAEPHGQTDQPGAGTRPLEHECKHQVHFQNTKLYSIFNQHHSKKKYLLFNSPPPLFQLQVRSTRLTLREISWVGPLSGSRAPSPTRALQRLPAPGLCHPLPPAPSLFKPYFSAGSPCCRRQMSYGGDTCRPVCAATQC